MGRKKENADENKKPITTVVEDAKGTKYQLRPLIPNTDVDFYKIYLSKFSRTLDGIMNQKMKLVLWLIRKMTLKNELKYSYREIAKLSGISYQTVAETIKALIKDDFIRRNGKMLVVNPNAVFRGRLDKKNEAEKYYNSLKQPPKKKEEETEQETEKEAEKERTKNSKKGQEKNRSRKEKPEKELDKKQQEAPEKEQEPEKEAEKGQEQKQEKKLKREPLSLKDRNDLEWEVTQLSKEASRLENWKDNFMLQLLLDEKKDENGEIEKIAKDIEKLRKRIKYLSGLLFAAELPEEEDKKDGKTQTKEPET